MLRQISILQKLHGGGLLADSTHIQKQNSVEYAPIYYKPVNISFGNAENETEEKKYVLPVKELQDEYAKIDLWLKNLEKGKSDMTQEELDTRLKIEASLAKASLENCRKIYGRWRDDNIGPYGVDTKRNISDTIEHDYNGIVCNCTCKIDNIAHKNPEYEKINLPDAYRGALSGLMNRLNTFQVAFDESLDTDEKTHTQVIEIASKAAKKLAAEKNINFEVNAGDFEKNPLIQFQESLSYLSEYLMFNDIMSEAVRCTTPGGNVKANYTINNGKLNVEVISDGFTLTGREINYARGTAPGEALDSKYPCLYRANKVIHVMDVYLPALQVETITTPEGKPGTKISYSFGMENRIPYKQINKVLDEGLAEIVAEKDLNKKYLKYHEIRDNFKDYCDEWREIVIPGLSGQGMRLLTEDYAHEVFRCGIFSQLDKKMFEDNITAEKIDASCAKGFKALKDLFERYTDVIRFGYTNPKERNELEWIYDAVHYPFSEAAKAKNINIVKDRENTQKILWEIKNGYDAPHYIVYTLMNGLLQNSVESTPEGGDIKASFAIDEAKNCMVFTVEDDGDAPRLNEPVKYFGIGINDVGYGEKPGLGFHLMAVHRHLWESKWNSPGLKVEAQLDPKTGKGKRISVDIPLKNY